MASWFRRRLCCLPLGARHNSVLEESPDEDRSCKKGCATPTASHGASTRIGRGPDCSPWASAGDNSLAKDPKATSYFDVPCAVAELEECEQTASVAGEAPSGHPVRSQSNGSNTAHSSLEADTTDAIREDSQNDQINRICGKTRPDREPDDETTRRLAQQIEEWGREQHGPDIVSIAKAYVGIQKMAEEEALNQRFNMIKHEAISLRPEAAHVFISLQRNDFEDLEDTPLPRHVTN